MQDLSTVWLVYADLIIPGRGEPITDGAVAVKARKIDWVGTLSDLPSKYKDICPNARVPVLMPGLWDCHCHYMGIDVAVDSHGRPDYFPMPNALTDATVDDLRATLMAGYTSVREMCGYAWDLMPDIERGLRVGPNIHSAHSSLSSYWSSMPISTPEEAIERDVSPITVCGGYDREYPETVRSIVQRGARLISVFSSGGLFSLKDDFKDRTLGTRRLQAIVVEATRNHRTVAVHAINKKDIMYALSAGRDGLLTIEYGIDLDEELTRRMKCGGTYLVATQHMIRTIVEKYLPHVPASRREKLLELAESSKESYKLAVKEGVKIALGAGTLISNRMSNLSHGNNAHELLWAVEAGMTPLQALECATANGPETLGRMAPLSGQLKEGYDADFIAVVESPLDDLSVLTKVENISHVWKGGELFKGPDLC